MSRDEFKLQVYFHMLKDKPSRNKKYFEIEFKRKYGKFSKIQELRKKIEDYQIKKYGELLYKFNLNKEETKSLQNSISENSKMHREDLYRAKKAI